ncbi:Gfo/Idh/MocA family protein [Paenibacillus harenae]|uniref:Gfo/Idh/MocA family protein n=1 Tax=Paenibacillus harenae TaxID=306543 RepID=UPI000492BD74|nr:Gfo/Idh/MocA family oxidoreductase [Paenibacillus harenae]
MLKIGLIGFGFMGRMHFDNYVRLMQEGADIKLVAICDMQIEQLKHSKGGGNIATGQEVYDLSPYRLYDDIEKMLASEEIDVVDVTLPTDLHAELACGLLNRGYHVLCEKPMARNAEEGRRMAETSASTGKTLMIGQCLRFWPAYEYLKECIEDGRYGAVTAGYFFRGSDAPQGWFLNGDRSGGCMLDMHIHDTDMVHWLFGKPERVSSIARNVIPGSAYDTVSTNYAYPDGKVVNAQADWSLQGDVGFSMTFRVNFERATLVFANDKLSVHPAGEPGFVAGLATDMGYYREIKYFLSAVAGGNPVSVCTPESAVGTLEIVEAEIRSADQGGIPVTLS